MALTTIQVKCKSGKVCPLCHRECLESWETVCWLCWEFLEELDRMTGTTYQQQIKDKNKIVIGLPLIVHKIQTCYYPLTPEEKQKRIRKVIDNVCSKCTKKAGMGLEDPCWSCLWTALMNEILGNGK